MTRRSLGIALATVALMAVAAPAGAATAPAVSVTASAQHVRSGDSVRLSGQVMGAPGAGTVLLYASPYPYPVAALSGSAVTSSTGSFTFTVHPDRDTRYRVLVAGSSARAVVQVDVAGRAIIKVRSRPLGQAGVTIVVFHPRDLRWGHVPVLWSFASGAHGRFVATPSSRTRRVSPYVVVLRTTVTLAAGTFRFRACFHAPADRALLNSSRPPGCTGRGYQGGGRLPAGFPSPGAASRAASYLATRTGRTAFAIVDSEGRLSGVRVHQTFNTASVVKAMLLVAYLRRLDAMRQHHVDSYSNSFLYPMIHISDNAAAMQCWSIVGDSGLYSVARAAAMTDFSVSGIWWNAQLSPADQARYFFAMDSLIPREFVGYARFLLSGIEASQSFGVPVVARPRGYRVYFKDGSEPTALGQLVHQVARLEGHGRTFSIAVMTDGDPSMGYGIDTIAGVTAALL